MRRERYIAPYQAVAVQKRAARRQKGFDVYKSIWRPRMKTSDAKDLFESSASVLHNRLLVEWHQSCRQGALRHVERYDDDAQADEDGDGISDEAQEVTEVFLKHERLVHALFTHYACLVPSLDVLNLLAWRAFVEECGLVQKKSKHCTWSHFEAAFMETDGMRLKAQREEEAELLKVRQSGQALPPNRQRDRATPRTLGANAVTAGGGALKHYMSRPEFLIGLIKIAVNRYVLSGELADVSDALERLLGTLLRENSRGIVNADPDSLRRACFYGEPACIALKSVDATLRQCFMKLASLVPPGSSPPTSPSRGSGGGGLGSPSRSGEGGGATLSVEEWLGAIRAFCIVGPDLSERTCLHAWAWSRMMVEQGHTVRGRQKEHAIPYEGFLELVCHLATVKGLPMDDEINEAGCVDAGGYLQSLEAQDDEEGNSNEQSTYAGLLGKHMRKWAEPPQLDLPRRIEHMATVLHAHIFSGLGQSLRGNGGGSSKQGDKPRRQSVASKPRTMKSAGEKVVTANAGLASIKARS